MPTAFSFLQTDRG